MGTANIYGSLTVFMYPLSRSDDVPPGPLLLTPEPMFISQDAIVVRGSFAFNSNTCHDEQSDDNGVQQQQLALRDLDLRVRKGRLVVIVGFTGGGKSALLHALLGELLPTTSRALQPHLHLEGLVALVPQQPFIYSGTVRENIRFYNPNGP